MTENRSNIYYLSSLFCLGLNNKFASQYRVTATNAKATAGSRRVSVSFQTVSVGRKSNSG